ncbi:hypothetical protein FUAX_10680 [Fulvitalea axinellae]|uniref:VIT domain-containing protein n=1 Tax=Fulvitalea axinellae TaxID=1182444 RepID=A0AAU9D704_9BACT|nr:hypothetical protein FUAX_10680 [Fulvitalea axinellae]
MNENKPLHLYWVTNILASSLIFLIGFQYYDTWASALSPESKLLWLGMSIVLTVQILSVSAVLIRYRKNMSRKFQFWFSIANLVYFVAWISSLPTFALEVMTTGIPVWARDEELLILCFSILTPVFGLLLFLAVTASFPKEKKARARDSILDAFIIPTLLYILVFIIFSTLHQYKIAVFFVVTLAVLNGLIFLFFLARATTILIKRRKRRRKPWLATVSTICFCVIFPQIGLALNNNIFNDGIFGNFSHPIFYILALVTGLSQLIPTQKNLSLQIGVTLLRATCLPFSLYFFLLFAPFIPLAVPLSIIGVGIIMLSPIALTGTHFFKLYQDFKELQHAGKLNAFFACLIGLFIIPASWYASAYNDKQSLQKALSHLDGKKTERISADNLRRITSPGNTSMIGRGSRRSRPLFNSGIPFLSKAYRNIITNGRELTWSKSQALKEVFLDEKSYRWSPRTFNNSVELTKLETKTEFDEKEGLYVSDIALEITNNHNSRQEFFTNFHLPAGAMVTDYYLWIEGEKVPGILAERSAAEWVYRNIVDRRRDPGLLSYVSPDTLSLKVFPVESKQTRKTGFRILHLTPFELQIENDTASLGTKQLAHRDQTIAGNASFVSEERKKSLPVAQRKPYFHFIVDCSNSSKNLKATDLINSIENIGQQYPELLTGAKLTFVNAYHKTVELKEEWIRNKKIPDSVIPEKEYGFFWENPVRGAIQQQYIQKTDSYPQFVIVSDRQDLPSNFTFKMNLNQLFPDFQGIFRINKSDSVKLASDLNDINTTIEAPNGYQAISLRILKDRSGTKRFLQSSGNSVILNSPKDIPTKGMKKRLIDKIIELEALTLFHDLHPDNAEAIWFETIKKSFASNILTRHTAFLSLENEAQRIALREKQKETLKNRSATSANDTRRMSEPSWLWWIIITAIILIHQRKSKKRSISKA